MHELDFFLFLFPRRVRRVEVSVRANCQVGQGPNVSERVWTWVSVARTCLYSSCVRAGMTQFALLVAVILKCSTFVAVISEYSTVIVIFPLTSLLSSLYWPCDPLSSWKSTPVSILVPKKVDCMCRISILLLFSFFFCKDGSDRLMKPASYSCCNFTLRCAWCCCLLEVSPVSLVVLAIRLALSFIVTHTHTHTKTPLTDRQHAHSASIGLNAGMSCPSCERINFRESTTNTNGSFHQWISRQGAFGKQGLDRLMNSRYLNAKRLPSIGKFVLTKWNRLTSVYLKTAGHNEPTNRDRKHYPFEKYLRKVYDFCKNPSLAATRSARENPAASNSFTDSSCSLNSTSGHEHFAKMLLHLEPVYILFPGVSCTSPPQASH